MRRFLYPVVNQEKCVDCGLCEKICVIEKKSHENRRTHTLFDTIIKRLSKHQVALWQFPAMFLKMAALYMAPADADMKVICKKAACMEDLKK